MIFKTFRERIAMIIRDMMCIFVAFYANDFFLIYLKNKKLNDLMKAVVNISNSNISNMVFSTIFFILTELNPKKSLTHSPTPYTL